MNEAFLKRLRTLSDEDLRASVRYGTLLRQQGSLTPDLADQYVAIVRELDRRVVLSYVEQPFPEKEEKPKPVRFIELE